MSSQYLLSSVSNALEILDLLSKQDELGLSEISKKLSLGKASTFRLMYTLEKYEYVQKTPEAKFKLGIKFAHYGDIVMERQNLVIICRPYLQKLRDQSNQTVHLAILNSNGKSTFIYKEQSNSTIQMTSRIGYTCDAYSTATGKALLAGLSDQEINELAQKYHFKNYTEYTIKNKKELLEQVASIRKRGYSEDLQESELGLTCFATPIRDFTGKSIAAISVSGATPQMLLRQDQLIDAVMTTASKISAAMGYSPE
jgi:DNA-binding IclR family transcriptional regulator